MPFSNTYDVNKKLKKKNNKITVRSFFNTYFSKPVPNLSNLLVKFIQTYLRLWNNEVSQQLTQQELLRGFSEGQSSCKACNSLYSVEDSIASQLQKSRFSTGTFTVLVNEGQLEMSPQNQQLHGRGLSVMTNNPDF